MDYFFQEQRWTDTFLSLHVKKFKRIILFLLIAFSAAGAKAQSDVKFNDGVRYSQWVIDSRMNDFYANTTHCGFAVYNQEGTQTSPRVDGKTKLDYVVGLVAKSIIEASQYYSQYDWAKSFAKPWFLSIQNYGDYFYNQFRSTSGSLDDLNAVKLFLPLRELTAPNATYANSTTYANTASALNTALSGLRTHNTQYSIGSETLAKTAGKTVAGGWWHKSDYQDQMWLDGSYMGPALFAQLVNYSGKKTNIDSSNDWDLIVKQFTILHEMCWNETAKLPYHAFAADGGTNSTSHSDTWAGLSSKSPYVFHSASYWGRAVGWYFLALVDILEQMEEANLSSSTGYTTLKGYLAETAAGIKARQDQTTGGWYQILDENNEFSASSYNNGKSHTTTYNYIESSATALFTAAYLKAIRLGYLAENDYKTVAVNGYKCLVNNFFSVDENGKVNIFGSCRSAGLGGKGTDYASGNERFRDGSNAYYLLGSDVAKVEKSENETEGKVLGAFIMAATEYERANEKAIRFSYDLAPSYTLAQGDFIKAEALGSGAGTATYQWYKTTDGTTGTAVTGATSETFTPAESGSYYCKATSGNTTIQTSTTAVTVEAASNENGGTETSNDIFSLTVTYNNNYSLTSGADLNLTSEYATVTGGSALVHNGKAEPAYIIYLGNIALNGSRGTYAKLTLDTPLQEGDVITFTSDENSIGSFCLTTTSTKNTNCSVTGGTYTVTSSDGLANSTELYVWSQSNGMFKSITITRTGPSISITTQPKSKSYTVGATTAEALTVAATVKNGTGYTVKYQWYENSTNANTGGTLISGETNESYTPTLSKTVGTKYYYCVVTATKSGAENLNATSEAAAVAVLNTSNLAIKTKSNYENNSNAWTPAVGGTISITDIVTSSSMGAYSITTGDAATLDGTSLTAVKDGTITLKQAADDNYKEGSIEITVRIGQDVTSNGSNAYSFTEATNVSDGMTIARKDITMTFGNDGFWKKPSENGYTGGQVNPQNITDNIPTAGTFYKFAPTKSGSLAVKVKLGAMGNEGNYNLRPLKVSENGKLINATLADGKTLIGIGQTPAYEKNSYQDNITFPVKANTDYYVYVPGSKLGFYNFTFSPYPTYTVTFNSGSNGTCSTTSISQSSQGERITLPDVTPADGYTFDGWYTDEALTSKVEGTTYTPTADITLYAKCSRITDLFKLSNVTSTKVSVDSKKTVAVTKDNATITGGSADLYNGHSDAKDMILNSQINLNGSGSSYIKITLDNTLKVGDEIIINPAASSFKLSDKASNSDAVSFTGSYVIQEKDSVVGQKVIYLYKGSNSLITDINITRYYPESDSRATFTYNGAEIAFSEKTAGDKSAYTTTLEIGASKAGESITITPTKQEGATIKQNNEIVNGNITITAPSTIGQTTTSTYTVTSKDGTSTTTYEINVKLVRENVVLVYAQSDGKTEWTWDKTANATKPTFTNPTLKVYLANADGTPSDQKVTVTGIEYKSDVEDVATVDNSGKISIKTDANGGAKIYAILKGNKYYNDAQTFFNILVKQGYSYSVADDATIKNGPDLNQSVYIKNGKTKLVKMTFGGWKWNTFKDEKDNNKLKSTYVVNEKTRTDEWKNPITSDESVIASIDGYKTYISGATDAVDESKLPSDNVIYGSTRYGWFKPAEIRKSDGYLETYPYSLPVRGAYMTFEPTQNGKLTVYILQNGAWNTNRSGEYEGINFNDGEIVAGEFRPHSFYICNQRGLNVDQFSPKTFTYTTKQKVQGDYYCNLTEHLDDPKNIATWKEFSEYMSEEEQDSVAKNWKSGINGAQKIVRLDNGSYLAIQKGIVKYSFFVTANETYYLFSNFSKLGFCGANFVPSKDIIPADDDDHNITLSDEIAYPKTERVTVATDGDKNEYAYKFDGAIKGYVKGFTIPLFKSITLNRTFKKDQWTTLSLPFNLTQTEVEQIFGTGTQIIVFDKANPTSARIYLTFFYHEIQNVLPGYPYLIRPTLVDADGKQMVTKSNSADNTPTYTITGGNLTEFTVYNKAINPAIKPHEFKSGDYTAKCTPSYCTANEPYNGSNYSMKYGEDDIFVSEKDGTVYISEGKSYGKGYRSYIDYTGTTTPPSAKALSISFCGVEDNDDNGTTTEIRVTELADDVIETLGIGGVYNLNGQKVADTTRNLPAGIYIVNGRKVVVK